MSEEEIKDIIRGMIDDILGKINALDERLKVLEQDNRLVRIRQANDEKLK